MNKYNLWKERVTDYKTGNLKASDWCEKNNVSITTLRYWITKFNKENQQPDNEFVKVTIHDFENQKQPIVINFNKLSISVSEGFDPIMLHDVLEAIGAYD